MTENNQAAASEDDQDVGHVGVGAYVALIITILFFSGLFYNIDGYKWLGSFDFTTLAGGFGKIDGLTYIGKGGFGARQGFLFALSLFPSEKPLPSKCLTSKGAYADTSLLGPATTEKLFF